MIPLPPKPPDAMRQNVSPDDTTSSGSPGARPLRRAALLEGLGRALSAIPFAVAKAILEAIALVYFRRIDTLERDPFPRTGPVLVVSNHPAAWTDVLVLDVALNRKLHFIAFEPLFHPWGRGMVLRLFGSLPIWFGRTEEAVARNRETFERCQALFRRGEVVALFPEGMSGGDRALLPLKTGAARLMMDAASSGSPPALLPIAIRYEDRTAFRADVVVAVGPRIPVEAGGVPLADPAHTLTGEIARALEASLASAEAQARDRAEESRTSPAAARPNFARSVGAVLAGVAGLAGVILHAIPCFAIEATAHRLARSPQQIALGRIALGLVLIPLWYLALAALAMRFTGHPWTALVAPLFGAAACMEFDRRRVRMSAGTAPEVAP